MNKEKPLTIGISKQGRVLPEIQKLIALAGYEGIIENSNGESFIKEANIRLVPVKGIEEVAYRMESCLLDGIMIGSDIAEEVNLILQDEAVRQGKRNSDEYLLNQVVDTDLCKARLALLKPRTMDIVRTILGDKRLNILSKYSLLAEQTRSRIKSPKSGINVFVREIESKADVLAGATNQLAYDIVDTGNTMRESGLQDVSGFVEEIGQDVWFEIPPSVSTSLGLFNTKKSSQDNAMIDFVASVKEAAGSV